MNQLRLVVVRHARTALTATVLNGCGVGASDPPLDWVGMEQAAHLVRGVPEANEAGATVLSSPAARCLQTASVWNRPVATDLRLCELDFGEWEGVSPRELAREHPEAVAAWWADPAFAPPGGTTLLERAAAWDRLVAHLWDAEGDGTWILVGHATTLRIAAARALAVDLAASARFTIPPTTVLRMRIWADGGSCLDGLTAVGKGS